MFRVGQKVVCVDAESDDMAARGFLALWSVSERIFKGQIYTIRRVYEFHYNYRGIVGSDLCVWLDEVERDEIARQQFGPDVGYGAFRFRPLQTKETDISIFTNMLKEKEVVCE